MRQKLIFATDRKTSGLNKCFVLPHILFLPLNSTAFFHSRNPKQTTQKVWRWSPKVTSSHTDTLDKRKSYIPDLVFITWENQFVQRLDVCIALNSAERLERYVTV
jgi:hypothetical protein